MSLSGISALTDLQELLDGDADLTALIKSTFHARVDLETEFPVVLYELPRLTYETGFGPQETSGQTAEAVVVLTAVDESSGDTSLLTEIATRLDDLLRAWAPTEWAVRNIQLDSERLDAFDSGGRTYQTASQTYTLQMERT